MGFCKLCRTVQTENMIDLQGADRLYGRKQMYQKRIIRLQKKSNPAIFFEASAINIRRTEESTACLEFSRRQFWVVEGVPDIFSWRGALYEAGVDLLGKSDKKRSILFRI